MIELQEVVGDNGRLVVAEAPGVLPFAPMRVFTIMNVPYGEARGTHAHRSCEQFLICMRGSVTAVAEDGTRRQEVILDRPTVGLFMPALTWGTQYNYSSDALLVVLASDPYDLDDYIADYNEFLDLVQADAPRQAS